MKIIGIAGGSGSGKSALVNHLLSTLSASFVSLVPQDSYYCDNSHLTNEQRLKTNFDHPSSIEFDLLVKHLDLLKQGHSIEMPVYDYISTARQETTIVVYPREIIIVEGILIFTVPELVKRMDIRIFIDAGQEERLNRIIKRDTEERGRTREEVIRHFETVVEPMHLLFVEPSKQFADIVITNQAGLLKAAEMLLSVIKEDLSV
ncbi:MAG: uridine kinase [Bacteroidetes bacterium]|nr:uridine kinase [Bacteroidota bacterium]